MRLRRAATCVSGARVALEAGRVLEAQERLEEACRLDPEGLEARILLEQLKSIEPEDLFEPILPDEDQAAQGARRWSHWVAVLIAVVALAALAWWRAPAPDETRATPVRQPERTRPHVESPAVVDAQPAPGLDPAPASGAAPPSQQLEADPLPEGGGASSPSASNQRTLARAAQSRVDAGAAGGERPRGTTGQSPARAASGAASPADRRPAIPAPDRVVERAGPPAPSPAQPPAGVEPSRSLPPLAEALPTVGAAVPDERMARARPVEVPTPAPPPPAAAGDAAPASLRDPAADEEAIGEVLGQY
ncbi:MAG TPA: hypothetical protein VK911_01635, partial [Vicinamibacterales bacterium]|nr:hypothetical protein [Vicinamibacterales bacterium]